MNLKELIIEELKERYGTQKVTAQQIEDYEKSLREGKEPVSDYIDINTDSSPIETLADEEFAGEVFAFIQNLIDSEPKDLTEAFTSSSSLEDHYGWHCLADRPKKKSISTRTNIFYDFRDLDLYRELEEQLNDQVLKAPAEGKNSATIFSLLDTNKVLKGFRGLFEGSYILTFAGACGFKNAVGHVAISFISFANEYTKNYRSANTIHCLIMGRNNRTVTLYPIDASYVEHKFNSFIKNYNKSVSTKFKINH